MTGAVAALLAGCTTVPATRQDPERAAVCKALQRSLAADVDIGASIPMGGFRLKWNLPNALSEERLVAVQDMLLHCALWRSHDITSEQFATAVDRATSVYASGRAEDIAAIEARMGLVEAGLAGSEIAGKRGPEAAVLSGAQRIGDAPDQAAAMAAANAANDQSVRNQLNPLVERLLREEVATGDADRRLARLEAASAAGASRGPSSGASPAAPLPGRYVPGGPPLSVFYATGSHTLEAASRLSLDRFATWAVANSAAVAVQGFADEQGGDVSNATLSQARADAAAAYLRERGVEVLTVSGNGESALFPGDLAANRRVVVEAFILR